eukprot:CAMPEP_0202441598 /NCGR_PEP_ID=MMETSP1360-20130828/1127_1 /ASSEMBLY_ACC=CAM_ASM_000848 /TAXON_ID=515479 /ORGANISM="Licmophora paradoxa, Strain CCMP2313" /LENGTH=651 /DNA_ID=CAMNT_0049056659 /DNA_START=148 /DNA_END=2103 /DNA_ORIENTATION=-
MPNTSPDTRSETSSIPSEEENRVMAEPNESDFKYESTKEGDVVLIKSSTNSSRHRRDLSAHFLDATRLTDEVDQDTDAHNRVTVSMGPEDKVSPYPTSKYHSPAKSKPDLMASKPEVGSKHRRGFSGDVSNPAVAHRRINSRGGSAPIDRSHYYTGPYYPSPQHHFHGHHRENSGGLDLLSAVADVSKEELAVAAGSRPTSSSSNSPNFHREQKQTSPASSYNSSYEYRRSHSYPYHGPPITSRGSHYSPYPPYYPPSHYHRSHHHSLPISTQHGPYPTQYAPARRQQFSKTSYPSQSIRPKETEQINTDERLFQKHWHPPRNSSTTGVQTYVTTIAVGEGDRTLMPAPPERITSTENNRDDTQKEPKPPVPATIGHHRKMSSYSSLGTLMSAALLPEPTEAQSPSHQRSNSSSVSFLHGLEETDFFGGQSSLSTQPNPKTPREAHSPGSVSTSSRSTEPTVPTASPDQASESTLASGGTSKRIRRKCTIDGCSNRVVQGGLCISHGAKRKTCKHPGCNKNVKKAGLCSTHGPARKRCEVENCSKVSVQGGRCIAHGAKKKLCSVENCSKQAILAGMCKKHHDLHNNAVARGICRKVAPDQTTMSSTPKSESGGKPTHTRGLSIFQEMSAESVRSYLSEDSNSVHPLKSDS